MRSVAIERDESRTGSRQSIPPIERFLDREPEGSASGVPETAASFSEDYIAEENELPPVEHFLDPLPSVGDFVADVSTQDNYAAESRGDQTTADWVETDWQQYDWRAAAALGDSGEHDASTAWAETDWDAAMPRARETKPTAAQAIATALDQIAQKIRDGELALPGPGTVTDPRTIATTLAALLGIRQ